MIFSKKSLTKDSQANSKFVELQGSIHDFMMLKFAYISDKKKYGGDMKTGEIMDMSDERIQIQISSGLKKMNLIHQNDG